MSVGEKQDQGHLGRSLRNIKSVVGILHDSPKGQAVIKQLEKMFARASRQRDGLSSAFLSLAESNLKEIQKATQDEVVRAECEIMLVRLANDPDLEDYHDISEFIAFHGEASNASANQSSTARLSPDMAQTNRMVPMQADEISSPDISGDKIEKRLESVESKVDSAYRSHLDEKSRDIQNVQENLSRQVSETIAQNEEFGVVLDVVLDALQNAKSMSDVESLKASLGDEIQKLQNEHGTLADKLDHTHQYLQLIQRDSRQLSDELNRVRLLSLTDELTGLSNRRAFLRRLEDEVGRVQRYGFPLSLVLMDLDRFKYINDKYGHPAGDEVLVNYAKNILSTFRQSDLVARYGGEEFAVLLPNTDLVGAKRALEKVREQTASTSWHCNGMALAMPTFSAGLAIYKPGETPGSFIERADTALYKAKRLGRDRVEVDESYTGGESNHSHKDQAQSK